MAMSLALDVLSGVYPVLKFKPANNEKTRSEPMRRISGDFLYGIVIVQISLANCCGPCSSKRFMELNVCA